MDSRKLMPVLECSDIFLLTPTILLPLIRACPSPEAAASSMRQVAPPDKVEIVFVLFFEEPFDVRQKIVKALQNEGYTNIESVDPRSVELSSCIFGLPLNCAVGEPVFISTTVNFDVPFSHYLLYVIQKCENGWQMLDALQNPANVLSKYPSAQNIVIYKNAPKAIKAEVRKAFPGLKLHFCDAINYSAGVRFMTDRIYKGVLKGYEVLPFCNVKLMVSFSNNGEEIRLADRVPPFTIDKIVDVGAAPTVEIYAASICPEDDYSKFKAFSFKSKAFRKVLVTVSVDKTLIPSVTLKTASTYKPRDRQTPVIYAVWIIENSYVLTVISEDHVSNEGVFPETGDVFAHIFKSSAIQATKAIFIVYRIENTISEIQEFRDFCAKIEVYPPVKLIFDVSVNLSLTFDRAGVSVSPGQTVVVLSPSIVYIIQRDGDLLQFLDCCLLQDYDINEDDVDTVIIENEENVFTQTDLEYLRLKYYPRTVIVLPGVERLERPIPKFFWSLVNGTDYGGNFFNNFGHFEFHIDGDGVAETVNTRFKAMPYTVTADVKVDDAKTLDVILFRSGNYSESLQKFDVPNGAKAVRFSISVESAFDITVDMSVIDETEYKRQPEKLRNRGHNNQKTSAIDLVIQFGTKSQSITLTEQIPFTVSKEVDVGDASEVTVRAVSHGKPDSTSAVKTLKFKKMAFRKVSITVNVDQDCTTELTLRTASTYKPAFQPTETGDSVDADLSQRKLDSSSTAVLTFTADNRVLVEAGKSYTGDKEFPAYVRLQSGKAPEVGQKAFDALKAHPGSVFYDVTRLLAADFDPDYSDPSWSFKTTRDSDGKVLVHGDDDVVTFPLVLFGMIVKCTLNYIKKHQKSAVPLLGIRLPTGSVISEVELKTISPLIGVELILLS